VRIHFAAEHALELEAAHRALEPARFALDLGGGRVIALRFGELEQFGGVGDRGRGAVDLAGLGGQSRALLAEQLGALLVGPDGGILEFAVYFFEALDLLVVLKETPVANGCALRGL
jgi:hypothetical protein